MSLGLSGSYGSSKSSSSQASQARTVARTGNRGGAAKLSVVNKYAAGATPPGSLPSWALIAAVLVFVLVVLAIIFAR